MKRCALLLGPAALLLGILVAGVFFAREARPVHAGPFEPIILPNATVDSGPSGICLLCSVTDDGNVIDANLDNAARITIPVGVGGSGFINVTDTDETYVGPSLAGFVVENPGDIVDLSVLQTITITTFLNDAQQESGSGAGLTLSDVAGGNRVLVSLATTLSFNQVQINVGALADRLNQLDVFAACVAPDPAEVSGCGVAMGQFSLTVEKLCDIDQTGSFTFNLSDSNGLDLDSDPISCPKGGGTHTFEGLSPGTYVLSEPAGVSGEILIQCDDGGETSTETSRDVTITDADVTCEVTNYAVVLLTKFCFGISGEFSFELQPEGAEPIPIELNQECAPFLPNLPGVATARVPGLQNGTHTLTETETAGAAHTIILCSNGTGSFPSVITDTSLEFEVAGITVCFVANTSDAFVPVTILKQCLGEVSGPFTIMRDTNESDVAECGQTEITVLPAGEDLIIEETDAGNGTLATYVDCGEGPVQTTSVTFEGVSAPVECTFINSALSVTVSKSCGEGVEPPEEGFTFTLTGPGDFEATSEGLFCDAGDAQPTSFTFTGVPSGAYTLSEDFSQGLSVEMQCTEETVEANSIQFEVTGADVVCEVTNNLAPTLADVRVSIDCGPQEVEPGGEVTCQIVVTNDGPDPAQHVTLNSATPDDTGFVSFGFPQPWQCPTLPPVGGNGPIFCDPDMGAGESASFTLVFSVALDTAPGTQLALNVSVTSETPDPDLDNNADALVLIVSGPAEDPDEPQTTIVGVDTNTDVEVNNLNLNDNTNILDNENVNSNHNQNINTNSQDQANDQGQSAESNPSQAQTGGGASVNID